MRRFWLFRSNLTSTEYYHDFKDLKTFIKNCHDYYMLFPLWLLQAGYFDEVTIWRLTDKPRQNIIFDVNGKTYAQKWCRNFKETTLYPSPDMSFWRGGFKEYDLVVKSYSNKFGIKVYLGAGQRINSNWGGKYDISLMEDEKDLQDNPGSYPFYKTASPFIFYPESNVNSYWDICWPCNFTQLKYKGQKFFIKEIAKSEFLKKLKIVHCGNKPKVGASMCKEYGVKNIEFLGPLNRPDLNKVLNSSKFGLNLSNRMDGCPRVSTEVLMSGTPLIIHEETRLLNYYKNKGVVEVNNENLIKKIERAFINYSKYKNEVMHIISNELLFDTINKKNIELWKTI